MTDQKLIVRWRGPSCSCGHGGDIVQLSILLTVLDFVHIAEA